MSEWDFWVYIGSLPFRSEVTMANPMKGSL
jgi:hypothetical protein